MKLGGKNTNTQTEKPAPVPLCPPKTPHGLACDQAQASIMTDQHGTLYHISPLSGPMALIQVAYFSFWLPCTTTLYFPLLLVIKRC
jgi:hypothetical protein